MSNSLVSKNTANGPKSELPFKEKLSRFLKSQQGWLFVLPAVLLMVIFTFYPIASAFVNALKENYSRLASVGGGKGYGGWGFENFYVVFTGTSSSKYSGITIPTGGANFVQCLVNTMILTFISVPLSTLLALLISVALNSIKPLQKAFQTVFFLPYLTNALAMGAVFATFFTIIGHRNNVDSYGLMNYVIQLFGGQPIDWISNTTTQKWEIGNVVIPYTKYFVMIVYEVWSGLPFKILILFSSLQSVNKQYYDAAKVDGASKSTILWKITTPLISPMLSYLIITGIMGGMKQYSAVVGVFGQDMGGDYQMGTMVGYIYQYLGNGYYGYAFAGSLILFAIIMVITVINLQVSKKRVHY